MDSSPTNGGDFAPTVRPYYQMLDGIVADYIGAKVIGFKYLTDPTVAIVDQQPVIVPVPYTVTYADLTVTKQVRTVTTFGSGSVTGGGPDSKNFPNASNWFLFQQTDAATLQSDGGFTRPLVSGRNLTQVGSYTAKLSMTSSGAKKTLTITPGMYSGLSGSDLWAYASNSPFVDFAPGKLKKAAGVCYANPGAANKPFAIDVTKLDITKPIYIYIHLVTGGGSAVLPVTGGTDEFTLHITSVADAANSYDVTLTNGASETIRVPVGNYTISEDPVQGYTFSGPAAVNVTAAGPNSVTCYNDIIAKVDNTSDAR